jgi:hypothetical protein
MRCLRLEYLNHKHWLPLLDPHQLPILRQQ